MKNKYPDLYQDQEILYEKGSQMVQNDINLFTMLETLIKVKAALTVLVGNNTQMV